MSQIVLHNAPILFHQSLTGAASGAVVGCYNSLAAGESFGAECLIKGLGAAGGLGLATSIKLCGKQ